MVAGLVVAAMESARDRRRLAARHAGKHRQPAGGIIESRGEQVAHDDLGRIGICPAKKFSSSGSVTRIILPVPSTLSLTLSPRRAPISSAR